MASDIEPAAYLVEWYDAGERSRVQLDKDMEPWLRANEPSVDSLYRSEVVDDLRAEIATLRQQLEEAREAMSQALGSLKALGAENGFASEALRRALSAPQGREG